MSVQLGYALSSEEHAPLALVENARRAEETGFSFALISDHFHPWVDAQGEAPFVWSVLGGIAHATTTLRIGTGVTCPMIRMHPAIVAHAAATAGAMLPGRFFLGVGTGENLNEHVLGDRWPPTFVRREMLRESIEVMRKLWQGELTSHRGAHYTVENARLYTLPDEEIEVMVAAGGPEAAALAGEVGDGLVAVAPDEELVKAFEEAGGKGKERFAQVTVCWAADEDEAIQTALKVWPNGGLGGTLGQELPLPSHFEQAAEMVTAKTIAEALVCGSDPERHRDAIREYVDAGFDRVYVHQIGPDRLGSCASTSVRSCRTFSEPATRRGQHEGAFAFVSRSANAATSSPTNVQLRRGFMHRHYEESRLTRRSVSVERQSAPRRPDVRRDVDRSNRNGGQVSARGVAHGELESAVGSRQPRAQLG